MQVYVCVDTKRVDTISPGEISQMVNYNFSLLGGMFVWSEQVDLFPLGVTSQSLTVAASWKWSRLHQLGAGQTAHTPLEMVRYTLQGWKCEVNCIGIVLYFLNVYVHREIIRKGKRNFEELNSFTRNNYRIYQRGLQKTLLEYSLDHIALASLLCIDLTDKIKLFFLFFLITQYSAISQKYPPKHNS